MIIKSDNNLYFSTLCKKKYKTESKARKAEKKFIEKY